MDDKRPPILSHDFHVRGGGDAAPISVDVAGRADFAGASNPLAAFRDEVTPQQNDLPRGGPVVPYCFHEYELSQGMATALRFMSCFAKSNRSLPSCFRLMHPSFRASIFGLFSSRWGPLSPSSASKRESSRPWQHAASRGRYFFVCGSSGEATAGARSEAEAVEAGFGVFCKSTINRPMSLMETRSLGETRSLDGGGFVAESF